MTWNDRVSFVLTDTAQVKKLKLLDVVLDGVQEGGKDDDGFDTDAAILTGELSALLPDLLEALGGEMGEGEPGEGALTGAVKSADTTANMSASANTSAAAASDAPF